MPPTGAPGRRQGWHAVRRLWFAAHTVRKARVELARARAAQQPHEGTNNGTQRATRSATSAVTVIRCEGRAPNKQVKRAGRKGTAFAQQRPEHTRKERLSFATADVSRDGGTKHTLTSGERRRPAKIAARMLSQDVWRSYQRL